jgi:membrane protein DedA with SNARE-associated domain
MEAFFYNFISWVESSKYILLFLGAIPEGPVMMMTGGFLYHLGKFDFWPMYAVLVIGDFIADITWYSVGRFGTRKAIFKYGAFFNITPETVAKAEELFNKYNQKILIISKLTIGFGFGFIILMVAGMFRVDFKKYVTINLFGGLVWTFFLIAVGYFFGNVFTLVPERIKITFIFIVLLIVTLAIRHLKAKPKNV